MLPHLGPQSDQNLVLRGRPWPAVWVSRLLGPPQSCRVSPLGPDPGHVEFGNLQVASLCQSGRETDPEGSRRLWRTEENMPLLFLGHRNLVILQL